MGGTLVQHDTGDNGSPGLFVEFLFIYTSVIVKEAANRKCFEDILR